MAGNSNDGTFGYAPLYQGFPVIPDAKACKEEWLRKADLSECARDIDRLFHENKSKGAVKQLKSEMFEQIYELMGSDVVPTDLERAVVVRNQKFRPCLVALLTVVSFGLFCIFRPRDDDAILVMTRQGRVLMLRIERPDFLSGNAPTMLLRFLRYLLILFIILSLPSLLVVLLTMHGDPNDPAMKTLAKVQMEIGDQLSGKLWKNVFALTVLYVVFIVFLVFWLWTKCPHDYGTHYRQSHAASAVAAGQFAFTGTTYRRRAVLRLFFGRYPTQAMLDSGLALRRGEVAGPIPREDLTAAGSASYASGGDSRQSTSTAIITFTIMLSVVTILDSSFNWFDRYWAVSHEIPATKRFCEEAPSDPLTGPAHCTPRECRRWAERVGSDPEDCNSVEWYNSTQASMLEGEEGSAACVQYGHSGPPCCGGCIVGGVLNYLGSDIMASFRNVLGILADCGTLFFSFLAARYAMSVVAATDHVDVTFIRRPSYRSQTSNLEMTQPLALHFFESVFSRSLGQQADTGPSARTSSHVPGSAHAFLESRFSRVQESPGAGEDYGAASPGGAPARDGSGRHEAGYGIKDFQVDTKTRDWDDFFGHSTLLLPGASRWWPKVNVPKGCLGIPHSELVLAAWVETPQMTPLHVVPNLVAAAALLLLVVCWPAGGGGDVLGKGLAARMLSAFWASTSFFVVSVALTYLCLFSAVQHVVIVTDLRLFYVRHRRQCLCLCMFGRDLRVDVFRHDGDVIHGQVNTTNLNLWQRLMRMQWVPGTILTQMKRGVLMLTRSHGNALDIFNVVAQLTKDPQFLDRRALEEAGVDWARCQDWVHEAMVQREANLWQLQKQHDDMPGPSPGIYLTSALEQPLFAWSFKELGPLSSPYNANTEVIVTTGRILLWSRVHYKRFDCKVSCCWGFCWCTCCHGLCCPGRLQLPTSMSFLSLSSLLSFSTETCMEPPRWYDPHHPPVKVPFCEELCAVLTRCVTCDPRGFVYDAKLCGCCPSRSGPKAQLQMMWRSTMTLPHQQPDVQCAVRPFPLPDFHDVDLSSSLGLRGAVPMDSTDGSRETRRNNAKRLETLRMIMGLVQDASMVS